MCIHTPRPGRERATFPSKQTMASAAPREWRTQSYVVQSERVWPKEGRHILAQYDEESIVVYQAYCPEIAEFAVKHQK